ncbi:carboxylate--amine ligase [Isachenkonia alkalipeptolytica]|uniref:Carboxylate--amine ligase n=1 Tax=Isachenkonia alkalipeptolytica TaxID=2565777 RepID=A0AA43XKJ3_9CLOT|nr:carboxylate--amine ligase [Isachenkonia alkalipeptolytica]NBG88555.1 carboxylate--amine ligase [Isachenkonia alkalipeptolytica]
MEKHQAVVLGSNYYIGLSTVRCLGKMGVPVTTVDYNQEEAYGSYSKYVTSSLIGPYYKEDPEGFIDYLMAYGKKQERPPVLIPTADPYVEMVDRYWDRLKTVYLLPDIPQGYLSTIVDKDRLYAMMKEGGILVPETLEISEDNLYKKVREELGYPCVVKPVDSHSFVKTFRKKLFKVQNEQELTEAIEKAESRDLKVVVQRIIEGPDTNKYTFDAYVNASGRVSHCSSFHLLRLYPNDYGASVYTEHYYNEDIFDYGKKILEDIGFKGFAELEFKKDENNGRYYLMEINVRIVNFNTLLEKIGLNMPYILYRDLTGNPLPPQEVRETKNRVFWYLYEDLWAVRGYLKSGEWSLKEVLGSLMRPKAPAIFDWKDLRPVLKYNGMMAKKIPKRLFKRNQ